MGGWVKAPLLAEFVLFASPLSFYVYQELDHIGNWSFNFYFCQETVNVSTVKFNSSKVCVLDHVQLQYAAFT